MIWVKEKEEVVAWFNIGNQLRTTRGNIRKIFPLSNINVETVVLLKDYFLTSL